MTVSGLALPVVDVCLCDYCLSLFFVCLFVFVVFVVGVFAFVFASFFLSFSALSPFSVLSFFQCCV